MLLVDGRRKMPSSIAENKRLVERYFDIQRSGNLLQGLELLSDDATWTVPGEWELSGTLQRDKIVEMLEGLNLFEGGLNFEHHSMTAEEDRVVVFTTVSGMLKDGRAYKNEIVFLFVIKDGKFSAVTEAPDSAKSRQFWLGK
jgi:ketosteroid isomerase-like protein